MSKDTVSTRFGPANCRINRYSPAEGKPNGKLNSAGTAALPVSFACEDINTSPPSGKGCFALSLVSYKMSLKESAILTQDEPEGGEVAQAGD